MLSPDNAKIMGPNRRLEINQVFDIKAVIQ